jgi:hypothetical protein
LLSAGLHHDQFMLERRAAVGAIDWKAALYEFDVSIPDLEPRSRAHA